MGLKPWIFGLCEQNYFYFDYGFYTIAQSSRQASGWGSQY
jgi:hypothetical protein